MRPLVLASMVIVLLSSASARAQDATVVEDDEQPQVLAPLPASPPAVAPPAAAPPPCYCYPCPLKVPPQLSGLAVPPTLQPLQPLPLLDAPDPRGVPNDEARVLAIIGGSVFAGAYFVAAIHAFGGNSDRQLNLIPVAGPLASMWRGGEPSAAWASTLIFSAWAQATGILVLGVAAAQPRFLPKSINLSAGASADGAHMAVTGKF